MRTKTKCANCGGRLVDEYRSGGYDLVHKVICVKCGQYCEKVWLDMGGISKRDLARVKALDLL